MVRLLPATSRDTSFGSMPGSGTSTRQPSSVAFTWNDGDEPAGVRAGRSLQNWLNRRSTSRWKLNTSSNEFQRVTPNICETSLLKPPDSYIRHACFSVKYLERLTIRLS